MEHKALNRIIAGLVFVISFVVYTITVAPTTSFWDCGEFITSSYIMGVPHPPGAPLFILIGRFFSMIPFVEDIGLRINMISVLVSAFSIMFGYLIIVRLLLAWKSEPESFQDKIIVYSGGVIGALAAAFSDSIWFNAVEAEVYAVSIFFTAIVVWLILVWVDKADKPAGDKIILLIAYLIGLATGVHLLNILAIPTLFLIIYFRKAKLEMQTFLIWGAGALAIFGAIYPGIVKGIPWIINEFSFYALGVVFLALVAAIYYTAKEKKRLLNMFLMGLMLVGLGYSTYTTLYIRSGLKPAINENHPDTPKKLVSYLNREQYGDIPLDVRRAPMWKYQIEKMYIRYFNWQFVGHGTTLGPDNYVKEVYSPRGLMMLPFLVGILGLYCHFKRDWRWSSAIMALFIMTGVAITIYLNQEDPQPRERDYAYVGSFYAFAIWIGIGASFILEKVYSWFKESSLRSVAIGGSLGVLLAAVPFNLFTFNFDNHNRSGNYVAFDYSLNILESCEPNAVLFTNGDNDTFPLWFLQYVYGIRTDIRVVNLSLLNTDWYIKQLRDEEPKVNIGYSNEEVDALNPLLWEKAQPISIPVPKETMLRELNKAADNSGLTEETIPEKPTFAFDLYHNKVIGQSPVILVQDRMALHIIAANRFERPIYFAVTVAGSNMLGLNGSRSKNAPNYMRMDGLAFKVMPYPGPEDFMSYEHMHKNIFEKFQYRNLDNEDVFFNRNVKGLLQNYRSAFLRLSSYYLRMKDFENVNLVLDKMEEVMPEKVIQMRDYQLAVTVARMYSEAGFPEKFIERVEKGLNQYDVTPVDRVWTAELIKRETQDIEKAESLALSGLEELKEIKKAGMTNAQDLAQAFVQTYMWLAGFYLEIDENDKAIALLEEWKELEPDQPMIQQQIDQVRVMIAAKKTVDTTKSIK